jgi:hypothetical protein
MLIPSTMTTVDQDAAAASTSHDDADELWEAVVKVDIAMDFDQADRDMGTVSNDTETTATAVWTTPGAAVIPEGESDVDVIAVGDAIDTTPASASRSIVTSTLNSPDTVTVPAASRINTDDIVLVPLNLRMPADAPTISASGSRSQNQMERRHRLFAAKTFLTTHEENFTTKRKRGRIALQCFHSASAWVHDLTNSPILSSI